MVEIQSKYCAVAAPEPLIKSKCPDDCRDMPKGRCVLCRPIFLMRIACSFVVQMMQQIVNASVTPVMNESVNPPPVTSSGMPKDFM